MKSVILGLLVGNILSRPARGAWVEINASLSTG